MSTVAQKKPRFNFKFKPPVKVTKPNIVHVPNDQWKEQKYRLFKWADNEIAKHGYNGNTANVLKELINCTDSKGITHVTLETIHNRLISRYGKAAPSLRTVDNSIRRLVSQKTISRGAQETFKGLIKTRLLATKSVMRSTQLLRTEYISKPLEIYIRKGDTSNVAAFSSTSNRKIEKPSHKAASAPGLGRPAAAASEASLEEMRARIRLAKRQGIMS